jgi:FkbM family methyltransferase
MTSSRPLITRPVLLAALLTGLLLFQRLLSFDGGSCGRACTRRVIARATQQLKDLSGGDKGEGKSSAAALTISVLDVPASRPYKLATCSGGGCACDICSWVRTNGVFAPVESRVFEWVLSSPACDGTKAVVDVGANVGTFTLLAATYDCVPKVIAFEPNAAPRTLAEASIALNSLSRRVVVIPHAVGASHAAALVDESARKWGRAAVEAAPPDEEEVLRARGVGDSHTLEVPASSSPSAVRAAAQSTPRKPAGGVRIVPLSEVGELTTHVLLLKIDTEGYEASVLAGAWALWDAGRSVDNVVLEVKQWNSRPKRDMLRHLARTGGLTHVYTYREMYGPEGRVEKPAGLANVSLQGRFTDVSDVIRMGRYDTLLPNEDFWLRKEALPADMVGATL